MALQFRGRTSHCHCEGRAVGMPQSRHQVTATRVHPSSWLYRQHLKTDTAKFFLDVRIFREYKCYLFSVLYLVLRTNSRVERLSRARQRGQHPSGLPTVKFRILPILVLYVKKVAFRDLSVNFNCFLIWDAVARPHISRQLSRLKRLVHTQQTVGSIPT